MHIVGVSLCLISANLCPISLFSFKFVLIAHIHSAFYGNVNTNASKYLYTKNVLPTIRMACDLVKIIANSYRYMVRICFPSEF